MTKKRNRTTSVYSKDTGPCVMTGNECVGPVKIFEIPKIGKEQNICYGPVKVDCFFPPSL